MTKAEFEAELKRLGFLIDFKKGDYVRCAQTSWHGRLVSIIGGNAYIERNDSSVFTASINCLVQPSGIDLAFDMSIGSKLEFKICFNTGSVLDETKNKDTASPSSISPSDEIRVLQKAMANLTRRF